MGSIVLALTVLTSGPSDIIDGDNGQLFPVNDELSF